MNVSGPIHAPKTLPTGKKPLEPNGYEVRYAWEPIWKRARSHSLYWATPSPLTPYKEPRRSSLSQNSKFRPIRTVKDFRNNSLSHEQVKSPLRISSLYKDTEENSDNVHKAEGRRSHSHIYSGNGRIEANHGTGWVFNVLKQKRTFYTYGLKAKFSSRVG